MVPTACRPEAYYYFRDRLASLHSTDNLVHCALAVAMHALDDFRPEQLDCELDRLARQVQQRCRSNSATCLVAHLHQVLFEEEQYRGTPASAYYNPLNSYLPTVVLSKRGLPVTLALVYKAVAERVGLQVEGISARGHFLVRVWDGHGWLIVDPYHLGKVYTVEEACVLIGSLVGETLEPDVRHVPTASNQVWLTRILVNLCHVFQTMSNQHDLHAMRELLTLARQHGV
jgi:regulator of sirC expression with transglutaminase-like and TPR domain